MIYNPLLRSNLTIHRMPAFEYEDSIVSKAGGFFQSINYVLRTYVSYTSSKGIYFTDLKSKRSMDIITTKPSFYEKHFPDPIIIPVTTILKWQSEVIPLRESIIHKLESRSVADTGK